MNIPNIEAIAEKRAKIIAQTEELGATQNLNLYHPKLGAIIKTEIHNAILEATESLRQQVVDLTKERDCWIYNAKELNKGLNVLDSQVKELRQQITELEKDKERLDWMDTIYDWTFTPKVDADAFYVKDGLNETFKIRDEIDSAIHNEKEK